jgi:uncharacterized protein (TIGR02996 family)
VTWQPRMVRWESMEPEELFLRAILADPSEPAPRLAYADWLEEHGGPTEMAQAEYLRVECELDGLPKNHSRRKKLLERLRALENTISADRWRGLDFSRVECCVHFTFKCPKRWDTLTLTEGEGVRHCSECNEAVYYCQSVAEAREHAARGRCVAVDTRTPRLPGDITPRRRTRTLGKVLPQQQRRIPLELRRIPLPDRRPAPGESGE